MSTIEALTMKWTTRQTLLTITSIPWLRRKDFLSIWKRRNCSGNNHKCYPKGRKLRSRISSSEHLDGSRSVPPSSST
uniref:Uncharacterized protein n=1 Tax=Lutzomyia longipalpis TaxID=7200 RepID=A0A1B0CEW2_LUTLO